MKFVITENETKEIKKLYGLIIEQFRDFEDYYNQNIRNYTKNNIIKIQQTANDLINGLNSKDVRELRLKIKNKISRAYINSPEETEIAIIQRARKILNDIEFAQEYIKKPTTQTKSEITQLEYLKNRGIILIPLKAKGKGSLRFLNNEIVADLTKETIDGASKSFDFKTPDDKYYFSAKVTTSGIDDAHSSIKQGGGQKYQLEDIEKFLIQANNYCKVHPNKHKFVGLVDGDYYTSKRINQLKQYESDCVIVSNSDEFTL
jgi:hypothetical protein